MTKILTIDLGTTYFKFTLFDRDGRLCHTCRVAPPVVAEAGRMELAADAFGDTIARGIGELRERAGGSLAGVEAVTFATQTNSFLLLDVHDRPLTPLVLWPDRRAEHLEAEVQERCHIASFSATTGIPRVNHQFMLAKLLWWRQTSPEILRQAGRICLISDYLTFLLTGRHATEAGAAGLTGTVDIHACRRWPEMVAGLGLHEQQLPPVVRAGTDLGPLDPKAAQRFRLPDSCRFIVGCLDQYAGAIGVGNVESGMISETTGTVLATVRCADHFSSRLGPAVFQGPAFRPGLYWRMVFGDISANYLQWYRDQLPDRPEFEQLTEAAASIAPGADGLRLQPDVGLTSLEAVFDCLPAGHTRGQAVRCILEAVARTLGDQIASLSDGPPPAEIRCAGGAARSPLWLQIKADMLDLTAVTPLCPEPTSLGAAILAEAALRATDIRQVARSWVRLQPPHRPDPRQCRRYASLRFE